MREAKFSNRSKLFFGLPLLAVLSACSSGPSEDDPAYPYHETRWVDQTTDLELRMEDGEAEIIAHRQDKRFDFTYTVDANGHVILHDIDQALFTKDVSLVPVGQALQNDFVNMHFIELTEEREKELEERVAKHKEAIEARTANRPSSPDGYRLLTADDLRWLMASRMLDNLEDENLADVFIPGYSQEGDAFARKELLDSALPQVKAKLAELAAQKDFRLPIASHEDMPGAVPGSAQTDLVRTSNGTVESYDTSAGSFPFIMGFGPCAREGMTTVDMIAGVRLRFVPWGTQKEAPCRLVVSDESVARRMEALRDDYDLESHAMVYFRFTGEKDPQGYYLFYPHRVDVRFYEKNLTRDARMSPINEFIAVGETFTLTEPSL